jgi:phosphatidylglycerophosphate synthase
MPGPLLHQREYRSPLAAAEKRLLVAIAGRLPRQIHSDHLSALGLASMVVASAGFILMRFTGWGALIVIAGLVANWFGDSLDGTVARVRGHERPRFGYNVDHVIDLAGALLLFAGLGLSGLMTPLLSAAVLAGYLLVSAETYLATHAGGVFRMASFGIGPTELRIILIAGALYAINHRVVQMPWGAPSLLFDAGGVVALGGFAVTFIRSAWFQIRRLALAEPRPVLDGIVDSAVSIHGACVQEGEA